MYIDIKKIVEREREEGREGDEGGVENDFYFLQERLIQTENEQSRTLWVTLMTLNLTVTVNLFYEFLRFSVVTALETYGTKAVYQRMGMDVGSRKQATLDYFCFRDLNH